MINYYNRRRNRIESECKTPKRIYAVYKYIRSKILIRFPDIYNLIIEDEYLSKGLVKDKTDFILIAVEEKFERDGINYIPKEASKSFNGNIEDMPLEP